MKCLKQPRFLDGKPIQISHLIEVRLPPGYWNRIKLFAWLRHRTYSTISRYCVLRLARKCSLHWTPKLRMAAASVQNELDSAKELHRHLMCLYGEDEKIIRLAALELGLTLTGFIRLAIELYLGTLAMENHSRRKITDQMLTAAAIRFTEKVQIFAANGGGWPFLRELSCQRFDPESYW